jgi:signal transduction histidine kinase
MFAPGMLTRRPVLLALAALVAVVVGVCVAASVGWVNRPFMGFLLGRNHIVAPIGLAHWTGFQADVPFGARLIAVDGAPAPPVTALVERTWQIPPRTPVSYTFETTDGSVTRTIPVMRFTIGDWVSLFGVWLIDGGLFLCLGFGVAWLRPGRPASTATLVFGIAWGLTLLLSLGDFHRFHFRTLYAAMQALTPAALVVFALTFPDRPLPVHRRQLLVVLGAVALAQTVADVWLYERAPALWYRFFDVTLVYLAAAALASTVVLWRWYRRAPAGDRVRLQLVGLGAIVAFGMPALIHLVGLAAGSALPVNVLPIATAVFPLVIGYAILQHDLFDLDPLVTRGLFIAALVTVATTGYLGLVGVVHAVQPAAPPGLSGSMPFVFGLGVVALVSPIRQGVQLTVDRFVFRTRYDVEAAMEELSGTLAGTPARDDILASIRRTLATTIGPHPCLLLLPATDGFASGGLHVASDDSRLSGRAQLVPLGADPSSDDPLVRRGIVALVVLRVGDGVEGVLAIGPKHDAAPYGARDKTLLRTLANQAAIALRNAASYTALRELTATLEQRVAARTAELSAAHAELLTTQQHLARADKLASLGRLVAGVAHEINNPVAFISSSVDLIHQAALQLRDGANGDDDAVRRATLDQLVENAGICRDGARRAAHIVRELRVFSRATAEHTEPVDLHAALERALQLLRGEYRDRIEVVRDFGDVPRPRCNPGQIDQICMNLLTNAVEAIEGRGTITLRTHADGGSVVLEVGDTGGGIPPDVQERIFEPFFTTKGGNGTGLGLAIVHSLVSRHGGEIEVERRAGGGTTFRVRLPVDPPAQKSIDTSRETT